MNRGLNHVWQLHLNMTIPKTGKRGHWSVGNMTMAPKHDNWKKQINRGLNHVWQLHLNMTIPKTGKNWHTANVCNKHVTLALKHAKWKKCYTHFPAAHIPHSFCQNWNCMLHVVWFGLYVCAFSVNFAQQMASVHRAALNFSSGLSTSWLMYMPFTRCPQCFILNPMCKYKNTSGFIHHIAFSQVRPGVITSMFTVFPGNF
jgi:hypothetical protein